MKKTAEQVLENCRNIGMEKYAIDLRERMTAFIVSIIAEKGIFSYERVKGREECDEYRKILLIGSRLLLKGDGLYEMLEEFDENMRDDFDNGYILPAKTFEVYTMIPAVINELNSKYKVEIKDVDDVYDDIHDKCDIVESIIVSK